MLKRNGSKSQRKQSRQKYTQRLLDLANAGDEFTQNVEEITNFTMPARRVARSKSRVDKQTKQGHAPTILSQVRKFGIGESQKLQNHEFVTTQDGVTDDAENYLPRRGNFDHSFMDPKPRPERDMKKLKNIRKAEKEKARQEKIQIEKVEERPQILISPDDFDAKQIEKLDQSMRASLNMASTSKLPPRSNMEFQPTDQKKNTEGSDDGKPISDNLIRIQRPFSQANSNLVAKQIKEKAHGSRGFLLNEDSEEIEPGQEADRADSDEQQVQQTTLTLKQLQSEHRITTSQPESMEIIKDQPAQTDQIQQQIQCDNNTQVENLKPRYSTTNFGRQNQQKQMWQAKNSMATTSANDFKKIVDLVNTENKRLWKLYDNKLDTKKQALKPIDSQTNSSRMQKGGSQQSQLKKSDSQKRVGQFIEAVKNHTIYRRDNFVRNLANQTKQSFDPYLKFQRKERQDPFKQRPLSSAVQRVKTLYPSRASVRQANQTDGFPKEATKQKSLNQQQYNQGQTRPLSSNVHNILLVRENNRDFKPVGMQGMSVDRLAKGHSFDLQKQMAQDSAPLSGQAGSKHTTRAGTTTQHRNVLSSTQFHQSDNTTVNQKSTALQHQRMLSHQLNSFGNKSKQNDQLARSRQRPVSSVPHAVKLQGLQSNMEQHQQRLKQSELYEKTDYLALNSDNVTAGDDFVTVQKILDPSVVDQSQPLTGGGTGGQRTVKQVSDTDMQFGIISGQHSPPSDMMRLGNYETKMSQLDSKQPVFSPFVQQTQLNTQPTRTSDLGYKSSQNLVQQLRIKSVRQSKVRIVQDPTAKGHYDIITDERLKENEQTFATERSPLQGSRPRVFPKDKVISNATNLHRASDTTLTTPPLLNSSNHMHDQTQTSQNNLESSARLSNQFPDAQCKQLSVEVLESFGVIDHMQDFLVYSQTRSPVFIFDPSEYAPSRITLILSRFKQCIEEGELEQATSLLDLGMKQKQFLPIFKLNVGVTYILMGRYMEAIQTFRMLSQSYPYSPSIHSNLLFAYLCDGWIENVKEFQSSAIFNTINAPLSDQTKSILELIQFAFTSVDLIRFNKQACTQSKRKLLNAPPYQTSNTTMQSAIDLKIKTRDEPIINDDSNFAATEINDDQMEFDAVEEEKSTSELTASVQPELNLEYFKKNRRIRDFSKREKIDPVNHLLRRKMREIRHPELVKPDAKQTDKNERAKTVSPNRQDAFEHLPNYWQLYQDMLQEYHRKDGIKKKQDEAFFQKVVDKILRVCKDQEHFQTGIMTQINKVLPAQVNRLASINSSSKKRTRSTEDSHVETMMTSQIQDPAERTRQEGDVNRILQKVKKVEEEEVRQIAEQGQKLDQIFSQLVSQRATYISDAVVDPIESSYLELIDGIGTFNERFNIRTFIERYQQLQKDIKQAEQIQKFKQGPGANRSGTPNISNPDEQQADLNLTHKELTQMFLDEFPAQEAAVERAKTFLLDVLFYKRDCNVQPIKDTFRDMAYFAEDRKRHKIMDQERFQVESSFIEIMREMIAIQQNLAQLIKASKSSQVVSQLQEQSDLNEAYIKLLNEQRILCGRHEENILLKNLEITKGTHAARAELAHQVELPVKEKKEQVNPVPIEKINYYRELYTKGWEKYTYRQLSDQEKLDVQKKVSEEADQVLAASRLKTRQRIIDEIKAKRKRGDEKTLEKISLLEQNLEEWKKHQNLKKENVAQKRRLTLMGMQIVKTMDIKEKIVMAHHDIQEYEFSLINAKLNLDAIEIKSKLPQDNQEHVNLWEETAALKVVYDKIDQIQETVTNPQTLFDKDKKKHAPQLIKWNKTAGKDMDFNCVQNPKDVTSNKVDFQNSREQNKEGILLNDEKKQHWQIKPKIGHEVTDNQIGLLETVLNNWDEISTTERTRLDTLLVKNNRFFSMFDQSTRMAMYKHCRINRHVGKDKDIERDVEETEKIQVLLRGNIHVVQINDDLNIYLRLASLRAGESFGDQSIQRKIQDPLKILSQERKAAITNSDETITISIQKENFMDAIFKEMQQELFYKIILLRNTQLFEELSPYSLTMIASNVEVKEVKYGEVIVQQGQVPEAMFILAYGQCKTVYQYVEEKSTKVSKYANKCLKSDLPQPVQTGMVNYKSLGYQQRRIDDQDDPQTEEKETKTNKKAKGKPAEATKSTGKSEAEDENAHRPQKRSFYHTILGENKKNMTIRFQNHLVYQKLKVGQFFGMRSLLDPLICKKHILEHREMFCKNLGYDLDNLWQELVKQQQLTLDQVNLAKVKRKEANKRASKFCQTCFEQEREHCTCLLDKLEEKERTTAIKERKTALKKEQDGEQSSYYQEFNDSHDYEMSMTRSNVDDPKSKLPQNKSNLKMQQTSKILSPEKAFEIERDRVREQIEMLTKNEELSSTSEVQNVQTRKKDHKERLQRRVENDFSSHLYSQLMKAQASIVVTSATAKLILIKKEDKGLFNEYLRVCLDRAILETNFSDLDRPESNHKDVQTAVQKSRGWTTFKDKFMQQIMQESKMQKKANKLLDD